MIHENFKCALDHQFEDEGTGGWRPVTKASRHHLTLAVMVSASLVHINILYYLLRLSKKFLIATSTFFTEFNEPHLII